MPRFLTALILLAMALAVQSIFAQSETDPADTPTIEELNLQLKTAQELDTLGDAQRQQIVELYNVAIRSLENARRLQTDAQSYARAMANATQAEVDLQVESVDVHMPQRDEFDDFSLAELRGQLAKEESETRAIRSRVDELQEQTKSEQSADLEAQLAQAKQQLTETNRLPVDTRPGAGLLVQAQNDGLLAQRVLLRARVENLEQRLLSRGVRLRLMNLELDLRNTELAAGLAHQAMLRDLINSHRQSAAEREAAEANKRVSELSAEPAEIIVLAQYNAGIAERISAIVSRTEETVGRNALMAKDRDLIEKKKEIVEQQLSVTTFLGSAEFGIALRAQRDWLAQAHQDARAMKDFKAALTSARLEQMQTDTELQPDVFPERNAILARIAEQTTTPVSGQTEALVDDLLKTRADLLQSLSGAYSELIVALTGTSALQTVIGDSVERYAELINERLLWMPSARPVGMQTIEELERVLGRMLAPDNIKTRTTQFVGRVTQLAIPLSIGVALVMLLLLRRRPIVRSLKGMAPSIGNVRNDRFSLTVLALSQTLMLALPGPLLVGLFGLMLSYPEPIGGKLGHSLILASMIYFQMEFILQSTRPNGLGGAHFQWDSRTLEILKRNLRWLIPLVVVVISLSILLGGQNLAEARHSAGRLTFIVLSLGLSLFAYLVLHPVRGIRPSAGAKFLRGPLRRLVFWLGISLPLLLAALSAVGYHFSAVDLEIKLMQTAGVCVWAVYIFDLIVRALSISERRLALERLLAKRQATAAKSESRAAAEAAGAGVPDTSDADELDIETISSQTRSLLTLLVGIGVILALSSIWADVLPAFKIFDNVTLWEISRTIDGVNTLDPITLWDVAVALLVAFVTLFASRNLPGVLEVVLLNRLSLESGTSYAVTSVSRYFIVIVGGIIFLQMLGAEWSKLQWLVAALSVGLGFGLQEIVANFVSGIVILFEKPIRLADTVTIDGQTGTVTRIRIRATTITDWDRKELIIPNKTFITQQLVNWTLSDPIMRLIVKVGVAYGSDVEQVEKTLLEVAHACPKALDDPPPVAMFISFGESSLDFELRVFLRGIGDYMPLNHELHGKIDKAFREQGIEISFPQRDLHIDNPKPIEVELVDRRTRPDRNSPPPSANQD